MIKKSIRKIINLIGYNITKAQDKHHPSSDPLLSLSNLVKVTNILKHHGAEYWLTGGTLLGAIRDGNFISHDDDIDIAVKFATFKKDCYYELSSKFKVVSKLGYPEESLELVLEIDGIKIDLFFVYEDSVNMWHSVFYNFSKESYSQLDYVYPRMNTVKYNFMNTEFNIPERPQDYLMHNYGVDWNLIQTKWDYAKSPHHIRNQGIRIDETLAKKKFESWIY